MICQICNRECNKLSGLSRHLKIHNISAQEYYDQYMLSDKNNICRICENPTAFLSLKLGYREFCSCKCSSLSEDVCTKKKNTSMLHFGVSHPMKSKSVQIKLKDTIQERYGVNYPIQNEEIRDCAKLTSMRRYGCEHPFQSTMVKNKIKNTVQSKYGVDNPSKCKIIQNKKKETNLLKYGYEHWSSSDEGRRVRRVAAIKQTEIQKLNGEPVMPRVGSKERPCLNELSKYTKYTIIRQDPSFKYTIGRVPDGHILELKLIILFDEMDHFADKLCSQLNKDSLKETHDYQSLEGYTLLRISELDWKFNKDYIINQFRSTTDKK